MKNIKKRNREELMDLMDRYHLSTSDVALLLGKTSTTIRIYRSVGGNAITDNDLELLRLKVAS